MDMEVLKSYNLGNMVLSVWLLHQGSSQNFMSSTFPAFQLKSSLEINFKLIFSLVDTILFMIGERMRFLDSWLISLMSPYLLSIVLIHSLFLSVLYLHHHFSSNVVILILIEAIPSPPAFLCLQTRSHFIRCILRVLISFPCHKKFLWSSLFC